MNDQQRTAMQMALEALEEAHTVIEHKQDWRKREEVITALREALAQYEFDSFVESQQIDLTQGEPVAFNEWYEANVKYMNIADFKPWMSEAWDAAIEATKEKAAKVCEAIRIERIKSEWDAGHETGCSSCAAAIRGLK
jgi:hypothetical protein